MGVEGTGVMLLTGGVVSAVSRAGAWSEFAQSRPISHRCECVFLLIVCFGNCLSQGDSFGVVFGVGYFLSLLGVGNLKWGLKWFSKHMQISGVIGSLQSSVFGCHARLQGSKTTKR